MKLKYLYVLLALLALALVGGCEEKQEVDQYAITDFRSDLNVIAKDANYTGYEVDLYPSDTLIPGDTPDSILQELMEVVTNISKSGWYMENKQNRLDFPLYRIEIRKRQVSCPPCPDTVRLWMRVDSIDSADLRIEVVDFRDTLYRMPPGQWMKTNVLCYWYLGYFEDSLALQKYGPLPDSVFVLDPERSRRVPGEK